MDDFYIYYEISPQNSQAGVVKAIAPHRLDEMEGVDFIRVPSEVGLQFIVGTESISRWIISYDASEEKMVLVKPNPDSIQTDSRGRRVSVVSLIPIPEVQEDPEVVVIWNAVNKTFNVDTNAKKTSTFFVTREGDPNILYFIFSFLGTEIVCDVPLPEVFSVYTKPEFSRYKLEIER